MEKNIDEEIEKIWERNKRVELDKKWETSFTRRAFICLITYVVVVIYSFMIQKISNVWLSSLVPVIGFTLSTLSLKLIRNIWEKKIEK
jgi:polyferredoxin